MMEIHTEYRRGTSILDVWIWERGMGSKPRQLIFKGAEEVEWREYEDGERLEGPSLSLPDDVWRALSGKINGVLPASEATERHLKDAVEIRDRLLTLVEKGALS